jgi:hypothetical protein
MPNRSMQVKHLKGVAQRAGIMQDVLARETFRDTTAIETVYLEDIIAAYKGPITRAKQRKAPARKLSASTIETCNALRYASLRRANAANLER